VLTLESKDHCGGGCTSLAQLNADDELVGKASLVLSMLPDFLSSVVPNALVGVPSEAFMSSHKHFSGAFNGVRNARLFPPPTSVGHVLPCLTFLLTC